MNARIKREIQNKTRLAHCLVDILEYDIDNLKNDAHECDPDELMETLQETKATMQNLIDITTEIEYALYLDKLKET